MKSISQEALVKRLMGIARPAALVRYLRVHRSDVNAETVQALKNQVDHWIRVDARRAGQVAGITLRTARLLREPLALALGLRARAQAWHAMGAYAQAFAGFQKALHIYTLHGEELEAAKVRRSQVDVLMYLGRYPEALAIARQARAVFEKLDQPLLTAQLDTNVGNIYHRLDQHDKALQYYERARPAFVQTRDPSLLALIDFNRANALVNLNQLDLALALYAQTHERFEACRLPLPAIQVLYNTAYAHFLKNNYQEALRLLEETKTAYLKLGDPKHLALSDLDSAEIHLQLNMIPEAQELAGEARRRFAELGMAYESAKAQVLQALAAFHFKDYAFAQRGLQRAQKVFIREGNNTSAALVDIYLADLYLKTGDAARAVSSCRVALKVFMRHGLEQRAVYARVLLARALWRAGRLAQARTQCRSLPAWLNKRRTPWLAYQWRHLWGKLLEIEGQTKEAHHQYARAIDAIEVMRTALQAEEFRTHFLQDKLAVYEDMILLCLKSDRKEGVAEALSYIERCKSRALVDLLGADLDARLQFPEANDYPLRRRWDRLRRELNWYYNKLNQSQANGGQRSVTAIRATEREIVIREKALGAMRRHWHIRHQEQRAPSAGSTPTAAEIQSSLASDEVLLEYYFAGDRLWIFTITPEGFEVVATPVSKDEITGLLRNLRFQIEKFLYDKTYIEARKDYLSRSADLYLQQLYTALIHPIENRIAGKKLIVVPFDVLHYVPFHALSAAGRYLMEDHEVSYAPSAGVWQLCRKRPSAPGGRPVVMGAPDGRVPYISEEVRTLARLFPQALLFEGAAATRANFLNHAGQASILHLAAHGLFRYDNPMFSGLRLADAWLSFFDIYQMELKAGLVMLSACSSGLNRVMAGDELLGLARGFLYAGASSLIVSQWAVNDRATAEFMKIFYGHLQKGATKRSALQAAQKSLKESYRHPFYWAPFILIGRE